MVAESRRLVDVVARFRMVRMLSESALLVLVLFRRTAILSSRESVHLTYIYNNSIYRDEVGNPFCVAVCNLYTRNPECCRGGGFLDFSGLAAAGGHACFINKQVFITFIYCFNDISKKSVSLPYN